jgi:hypothetical protein
MAMFDDAPGPVSLRVGDAERAAAVTRLSDAYANDYLTEIEFERRVALVYQAAITDDLSALTRDLPQHGERVGGGPGSLPPVPARRISAVLSSVERAGADILPTLLEIHATMGNIELDFTQATFRPGVTEIRIRAKLASIELEFPGDVQIIVETARFAVPSTRRTCRAHHRYCAAQQRGNRPVSDLTARRMSVWQRGQRCQR